MAQSGSEQTDLRHQLFKTSDREKLTEDYNFKMRRSFSWDRSFFTSDGVLDDEELSSMIEGDGNNVKHQLDRIDEIENLETKLFEEIEAATKKSNLTNSNIQVSSGDKDSQAKASRFGSKATQASKVASENNPLRASGSSINTQSTRSSPLSGSSYVKSSSSLARRSSPSSKTKANSPSRTPPGISTKNKVMMYSNLSPRATRYSSPGSPSSPGSAGSSSSTTSTFSLKQRPSRSRSAPRRSTVKSEKASPTNARKRDDQKINRPTPAAGVMILNKPSNISLKSKPAAVDNSHPLSPLGFSSSSISQHLSESSSSLTSRAVDQRSTISRGRRGSSVVPRTLNSDASAKSCLMKNHPRSQTPERNRKQPAALRPQSVSTSRPSLQSPKIGIFEEENKSGSSNGGKTRRLPSPRRVAALTDMKPNSQKTIYPKSSREQSGGGKAKASKGVKNILLVSPEILDIKGKLNALKMEINMHKKDKSKMTPAESGKGESSSSHHVGMIQTKNQAKST